MNEERKERGGEWPEGCRLISIPGAGDQRGWLAFAEARRGGHAHRTCAELVVPVSGAFTMVVDDGRCRRSVRMDNPCEGILVPAGVWCELIDFEPATVLVVMASQPYTADGYVHDYQQYLQQRNTTRQ